MVVTRLGDSAWRELEAACALNLERHAEDGSVWLSRIKLEEDKLEFEGFGQYPQSLPRWIDKLKQTESLRGRSFASMTMVREPGQPLAFVLTSEAREVKK